MTPDIPDDKKGETGFGTSNYIGNFRDRYGGGIVDGFYTEMTQNPHDSYLNKNLKGERELNLSFKVDEDNNRVIYMDNAGGMTHDRSKNRDKPPILQEAFTEFEKSGKDGTESGGFRGQGSAILLALGDPEEIEVTIETLHEEDGRYAMKWYGTGDKWYEYHEEDDFEADLHETGTRIVIENVDDRFIQEMKSKRTINHIYHRWWNELLKEDYFNLSFDLPHRKTPFKPESLEPEIQKTVSVDADLDDVDIDREDIEIESFKVVIFEEETPRAFKSPVALNNHRLQTIDYYSPQQVIGSQRIRAIVTFNEEATKCEQTTHRGYLDNSIIDDLKDKFIKPKIKQLAGDELKKDGQQTDAQINARDRARQVFNKLSDNVESFGWSGNDVQEPTEGGEQEEPDFPFVKMMTFPEGVDYDYEDEVVVTPTVQNPTTSKQETTVVLKLLPPSEHGDDPIKTIGKDKIEIEGNGDGQQLEFKFEAPDNSSPSGRYRIQAWTVTKDSNGATRKIGPEYKGLSSHSNWFRLDTEPEETEGSGVREGFKDYDRYYPSDETWKLGQLDKESGQMWVNANRPEITENRRDSERQLLPIYFDFAVQIATRTDVREAMSIADEEKREEKVKQVLDDAAKMSAEFQKQFFVEEGDV